MRTIALLCVLTVGCSPSISTCDISFIYDSTGCTSPGNGSQSNAANGSFADGLRQYQSHNYQAALDIFQALAKGAGDARTRVNACLHAGYSFRMLGEWEKSACAFLQAESIWKSQYMQGGDTDNATYSSGVLSRIYTELTRTYVRLGRPVVAAIFAWATLRDKKILDPSISVTKMAHHPSFLKGIDQQTFTLFFDSLHPLPETGKIPVFPYRNGSRQTIPGIPQTASTEDPYVHATRILRRSTGLARR